MVKEKNSEVSKDEELHKVIKITLTLDDGSKVEHDFKPETVAAIVEESTKKKGFIADNRIIRATRDSNGNPMGMDGVEFGPLAKFGKWPHGPNAKGISVEEEVITYIDGNNGILLHRGVSIKDWTEKSNFLELSHALINGLPFAPDTNQEKEFSQKIAKASILDARLKKGLRGVISPADAPPVEPQRKTYGNEEDFQAAMKEYGIRIERYKEAGGPMKILQTAISFLAKEDGQKLGEKATEEQIEKSYLRVMAVMPTLFALVNHHLKGDDLINFRFPKLEDYGKDQENYSHAGNMLKMMYQHDPDERKRAFSQDPEIIKAVDTLFSVHADHEQNASTSNAKNTSSTGRGMWGAIGNGSGSLAGTKHGKANVDVMNNLRDILAQPGDWRENVKQLVKDVADHNKEVGRKEKEEAKNPGTYTKEEIGERDKVPGVGHAVYKAKDPRADAIKIIFHKIKELSDQGKNPFFEKGSDLDQLFQVASAIEEEVDNTKYFADRGIKPNVDFYSGIVMRAIGFDERMLTVFFATGRTAGWAAHVTKDVREKAAINRPRATYTGWGAMPFEDALNMAKEEFMGEKRYPRTGNAVGISAA